MPSSPLAISPDRPLILASGSRYRAALLERLGLPFERLPVDADERPLQGESPVDTAERLSALKAELAAAHRPGHWVLGCDQTAEHAGTLFGKPGTVAAARAQLQRFSGQAVRFHSALTLLAGARRLTAVDTTTVIFRSLEAEEIERYVAAEPALDCAGGFKVEGLGITLFERIESGDPTSLIGLPLIRLSTMLRALGYPLP